MNLRRRKNNRAQERVEYTYTTIPVHKEGPEGVRAQEPDGVWIRWNVLIAFMFYCLIHRKHKRDVLLRNVLILLNSDKAEAQILDKKGEFYIIPRQIKAEEK